MKNELSIKRVFYDADDEMFVAEFLNLPGVDYRDLSHKRDWSMYAHGVCFPLSNNTYEFDKLGITEQHSAAGYFLSNGEAEKARTSLQHRLRLISERLRKQTQDSSQHQNSSLCLAIAQTLDVEENVLISAWITSWKKQNR